MRGQEEMGDSFHRVNGGFSQRYILKYMALADLLLARA